jgi:cob(I)alamin adenosyltransferase
MSFFYPRERRGDVKPEKYGLIHVYFGEGVGKTTRAIGLAVRAAGEGLRVGVVQFMKSGKSGEVQLIRGLDNIVYYCPGRHPFILSKGPQSVHFNHARKGYEKAMEFQSQGVEILICDEILNTLLFKLLSLEQILHLMDLCKDKTELIMTGRNAPAEIIHRADYVTEFVQIKHPYYEGQRARRGIEY